MISMWVSSYNQLDVSGRVYSDALKVRQDGYVGTRPARVNYDPSAIPKMNYYRLTATWAKYGDFDYISAWRVIQHVFESLPPSFSHAAGYQQVLVRTIVLAYVGADWS